MATQFDELLRSMATGDGGLQMQQVIRYAAVAIPGAEHAAITVSRGGGNPRTLFATDDLPLQVDALQYRVGEGPCLAALSENDLVLVNDLAHDGQFPQFSPGAVELGVRSMLSTRLFLSTDHRAALNFYASRPRAFVLDQLPLAAIFGSFASLLLLNELQENTIAELERALESSREIGVAMGILMAHERFTRDQAFDQLTRASQSLNRRLRDIADEVNRTGQLPTLPKGRRRRAGEGRDRRTAD